MLTKKLSRYIDRRDHLELISEYTETIEGNGWWLTDSHTTEEGSVLRSCSQIVDDDHGFTGKLVILIEDGYVVSHGASISRPRSEGSLEEIVYFEYDPQEDEMNRIVVSARNRSPPEKVSCEVCLELYKAAKSLIQNGPETVRSITVADITTKANGDLNSLREQVTRKEKVCGARDVNRHITGRGNVNQSPMAACQSMGHC